jgi:hypothetical protein
MSKTVYSDLMPMQYTFLLYRKNAVTVTAKLCKPFLVWTIKGTVPLFSLI